MLKAFFEQIFRPGFAFQYKEQEFPKKLLKGKSARIVNTMGMPAFFYPLVLWRPQSEEPGTKHLRFCGIGPIGESLFGMVETVSDTTRQKWLAQMHKPGEAAR